MSHSSIIALVLRDKFVEWTALQSRKHRYEIVQQKRVELDWPEAVADHRSPEAAAFLKTKLPPMGGRVGIVVPADRVLMRVVDLPSTDRDELLGMAELQVDKFSPFPSDQMALAVEILRQEGESSRVLIAAVQHDTIDQLGGFLMKAGVYPQVVDVDVLGWWTLISEAGKVSGSGQEVVVIHDEQSAQMLVTRDGVPLVIRALDAGLDPRDPAVADQVAEEIEYTLMTIEGVWGAQATSGLTLWSREDAASEVVEALAAACRLPVTAARLDALPPLSEGLSRRLARPDGGGLDLAPLVWKRGIQSRKYQRQAILTAAVAFGAWGLLMAGLWWWTGYQKTQLQKAQATITQLQSEVEQVRELRGQVEWLEQYADRSRSALECLREVCLLLPPGVDITSITYSKASQVNLRGECDSDAPINDFIDQLEKSETFTAIKTENIQTQVRGGRNRSLFRVTMMLPTVEGEQAAEGAPGT